MHSVALVSVMNTKYLLCGLCALMVVSCGRGYHKKNQEQPLVSPSGKYVLTVPIERAADRLHYWRVTISNVNGNVLFKDDSEFVGHLNVYWSWDDRDRVWLKNSDNGYTYYWEIDDKNAWRRYQCKEDKPLSYSASPSPTPTTPSVDPLPCTLSPIKK